MICPLENGQRRSCFSGVWKENRLPPDDHDAGIKCVKNFRQDQSNTLRKFHQLIFSTPNASVIREEVPTVRDFTSDFARITRDGSCLEISREVQMHAKR